MNVEPEFENGEKVVDKISGFEGTVLGISIYYNGCVRYMVQPLVGDDGTYREYEWVDEEQLESKGETIPPSKKKSGGFRPSPVRR